MPPPTFTWSLAALSAFSGLPHSLPGLLHHPHSLETCASSHPILRTATITTPLAISAAWPAPPSIMADQDARPHLLKLPLEIRHVIFKYAAAREDKPSKLLRNYFENVEIKATIAQEAANNPTGPTPVAAPPVNYPEDSDEHDDENDEDEDDEGNEDDEEAGEEFDEDNEDMEDVDGEESEDEVGAGNQGIVVQTMTLAGNPAHSVIPAPPQAQQLATMQGQVAVIPSIVPTTQSANNAHTVDAEEDNEEMEDADQDDDGEGDGENGDEQDEGNDDDDDGEAGSDEEDTQPRPVPPRVIHPHRKWRHITKFMRLTRNPPPKELLMVCKDLNTEAKDWYYNVAILKIIATASFAHTTFFEESFDQIFNAAFSPMENIRKVEVTFAWDTAWIRSTRQDAVASIFPALLRERAVFVHKILRQAPDLKELKIHWHDSADDDESNTLKSEILEPFLDLPAALTIEDHYIASDAKPNSRSVAGVRRLEFERILTNGLDRLF